MVGFLGHRAMKLLGPVLVASFAAACSSGAATPSPAATATVGSAAASASAASTSGPQVTVSILLPDNTTPRYESQDKPAITAALTKYIPNVKVVSYNALGDGAKQLSQAEEALTNGSKVLIVIPQDSNAAAAIVAAAHKDNVPVIAYTRIINNSPLDYFIGKDTLTIGKQEGQWIVDNTNSGDTIAVVNGSPTDQNAKLYEQGYMGILQPLFTSGQRKLGGELWTPNWDPTNAQNEMDQLLTKNADNVQAVIGPNDNMAGGVVASLSGKGLAGKVKVTGLDATVAGLQRIIERYALPFVAYNQGSIVHLETSGVMLLDLKHPLRFAKQMKPRKHMIEEMGAAYTANGVITLAGSRMYTSMADTDEVIDDALERFERVLSSVEGA